MSTPPAVPEKDDGNHSEEGIQMLGDPTEKIPSSAPTYIGTGSLVHLIEVPDDVRRVIDEHDRGIHQ